MHKVSYVLGIVGYVGMMMTFSVLALGSLTLLVLTLLR